MDNGLVAVLEEKIKDIQYTPSLTLYSLVVIACPNYLNNL
jgi:hypothetical protein